MLASNGNSNSNSQDYPNPFASDESDNDSQRTLDDIRNFPGINCNDQNLTIQVDETITERGVFSSIDERMVSWFIIHYNIMFNILN